MMENLNSGKSRDGRCDDFVYRKNKCKINLIMHIKFMQILFEFSDFLVSRHPIKFICLNNRVQI